jgi:hypothetical protein
MGVDLQRVVVALAQLTDSELNALIDARKNVPQIGPGFRAWLGAALDWELNRRQGRAYALRPPAFAIAPEEDAVNFFWVTLVRAMFGQGALGVHALFDALVELLSDGGRKH